MVAPTDREPWSTNHRDFHSAFPVCADVVAIIIDRKIKMRCENELMGHKKRSTATPDF
jgi:hypothetical protein